MKSHVATRLSNRLIEEMNAGSTSRASLALGFDVRDAEPDRPSGPRRSLGDPERDPGGDVVPLVEIRVGREVRRPAESLLSWYFTALRVNVNAWRLV